MSGAAGSLTLIKGVAAECVPTLFGEAAAHEQVRRLARGAPNGKQHVRLLIAAANEFQQIVALVESACDRHDEGAVPVRARDQVDSRREPTFRLGVSRDDAGAPHLVSAFAAVVAHAIRRDAERGRRRRDVQPDVFAALGIVQTRETFDEAGCFMSGDFPRRRARELVLGDHRRRLDAVWSEEGFRMGSRRTIGAQRRSAVNDDQPDGRAEHKEADAEREKAHPAAAPGARHGIGLLCR